MEENRIPEKIKKSSDMAYYHLPGLFEFYDFYKEFLPLYTHHRYFFYDWCEIGSIYGAPADCIWGGGRVGFGEDDPVRAAALMREYGISARLTFSNSLLTEEHLKDRRCNSLAGLFHSNIESNRENTQAESVLNGIIITSDCLLHYLQKKYPNYYFVSSTTKVITDFDLLRKELNKEDFLYVVPDFRWNRKFDFLQTLSEKEKKKVEFLCNECCSFGCKDRKACYENVSRKSLGEDCRDHICTSDKSGEGYRFSKAMRNPGFIGIDAIRDIYLPMGFSNFKIEGRGLGSALLLEFILYYMTKPEYQMDVREALYLDSMLDLF